MRTVTVSASKTYDIKIGSGLLPTLGMEAAKLGKAANICIVSESNVWPLPAWRLRDLRLSHLYFLREKKAKTVPFIWNY